MNTPVSFQPAASPDLPLLLEMMQDFYSIDGYPFEAARTEANLLRFLAVPELGRLWMIRQESECIGYLVLSFCFSFEFGGRTAFIDELYLRPQVRSRGIGAQAVDFAIGQAGELQLAALHLEVEGHNEAGKRLYAKKGFKVHHRSLMTRMMTDAVESEG